MIRIEGLSKRFGRRHALRDVTFAVPEGSIFALIGPNGAGKTTLLRILMNLLRPDSGQAHIMGRDSRHLGHAHLARIGYVSENQILPEWMRVGGFLAYSKEFYPSWDAALAVDLVREYELPLDRRLRNLSRGMKVKAALTAALAYRPSLILLDEPFGGLDVLVREQLIGTILDRTPEATVLISTHDLAEIESFATHAAYLNEGRLEFAEEMAALSGRFREVEITLDTPAPIPAALPDSWLVLEHSGVLVRFTDARYDPILTHREAAIRFTGVRDISVREMSFRSIFLTLAKSRKPSCV